MPVYSSSVRTAIPAAHAVSVALENQPPAETGIRVTDGAADDV